MSFEPQTELETLDSIDRRVGPMIGLGIIGLALLVVGLLFLAGPGRSALRRRDGLEDELDLAG